MPDRPLPTLPSREGIPDAERALEREWRSRYARHVEELVVHREVASPAVTLVVVSYRAKDYLVDCLAHLARQKGRHAIEILLADSGGLEHLRQRTGPLCDVELRLTDGISLNAARNAAMAWARGGLVAYIDDDGLVQDGWVDAALGAFADPAVGVARGKIVPLEHRYFNTYAVHYDRGEAIWDDDSLATEGNMLVRRGVYLEIGGFPDDFYGAEGTYLVYRMKRAYPSMRALYVPGMAMRHDYSRSLREFVWKCRKYRTTADDTTKDDPAFRAFLEAYGRTRKPSPRRTLAERVALRLLRTTAWAVVRVPALDRIARR